MPERCCGLKNTAEVSNSTILGYVKFLCRFHLLSPYTGKCEIDIGEVVQRLMMTREPTGKSSSSSSRSSFFTDTQPLVQLV